MSSSSSGISAGSTLRSAAWGRGLVVTVGAILIMNALWLFTAVGTPQIFQQDTGVSLEELSAAYPRVAAVMELRGQLVALFLGGAGILTITLAVNGHFGSPGAARRGLWVQALVLAGVAAFSIGSGRLDIAASYLITMILLATGLLLSAMRGR